MTKRLAREIWIVAARRTPFGDYCGAYKNHSATDLGAIAARAALEQAGVPGEAVDHVVMGNVDSTSVDGLYMARHVALRAGVAVTTPAVAVNRLCGSGFQAVVTGAEQIALGDAEICLVGGTENMSQTPHVVRGLRFGVRLGTSPVLEDALWSGLTDHHVNMGMADTAEKLAEQHQISREECDAYALRSQRLWKAANDAGKFRDEVVPVEITTRKETFQLGADESPRPDTSAEALARLKPVFKKNGVVTAGNASGISDGAACLVLASKEAVERRRLKPLARVVQWGVVGCDPTIMGIGPVPAMRIALERAGLTLDQMDLIEVNEAFAPQYIAVERELGLDRERTNVNGGSIALGHPLGASGARITAHICYELARRPAARYAIGSACIGGGQGIAVVLERA